MAGNGPSPPSFALAEFAGWEASEWQTRLPFFVEGSIFVTNLWDSSYIFDRSQWRQLLEDFPMRVDPNTLWLGVTLAKQSIGEGAAKTINYSLYVSAHVVKGNPRLFVYHFGAGPNDDSDAVQPLSFTLSSSSELSEEVKRHPAWPACSSACEEFVAAYNQKYGDKYQFGIDLYYLPKMDAENAPTHQYLLNLLLYLQSSCFLNKMQMNAISEASKDLGARLCSPYTDWFLPHSTGMRHDPNWQASLTYLQRPYDPTQKPPVSNYMFSEAHLSRGIPVLGMVAENWLELFLLIQEWKREKQAKSPGSKLPDDENFVTLFLQLWPDQQAKIEALTGVKLPKEKEEQTPPLDPEVKKMEDKIIGVLRAINARIAEVSKRARSLVPGAVENLVVDLDAAETTAQEISRLIFEVAFRKLSLNEKIQLVLSTKLNHRHLHQVRLFFLACQLLSEALFRQAKERYPALAQLTEQLQRVRDDLAAAERVLDAEKEAAAPKKEDEHSDPRDDETPLIGVATALVALHKRVSHENPKHHPEEGTHAAVRALLEPLATLAAQAKAGIGDAISNFFGSPSTTPASSLKEMLASAVDSAAGALSSPQKGKPATETAKPTVSDVLAAILEHLPAQDDTPGFDALRGNIQKVQSIVSATLVIETIVPQRMALIKQLSDAEKASPDFMLWQGWQNTFSKVQFSMREAQVPSKSLASASAKEKASLIQDPEAQPEGLERETASLIHDLEALESESSDFFSLKGLRRFFLKTRLAILKKEIGASSASTSSLSVTLDPDTQKSTVVRSNIVDYIKGQTWLPFIHDLEMLAYRLEEEAQEKRLEEAAAALNKQAEASRIQFLPLLACDDDYLYGLTPETRKQIRGRIKSMQDRWEASLARRLPANKITVTGIPASNKRLPQLLAKKVEKKWAWVVTTHRFSAKTNTSTTTCCLFICGHEADFEQLNQRSASLNIDLTTNNKFSMPNATVTFGEAAPQASSPGSGSSAAQGAFAYQEVLCASYSHIVIALAQALANKDMLESDQTALQVPVYFMKAPDPQDFQSKLSRALAGQLALAKDPAQRNQATWENLRKTLQAMLPFTCIP